jgi:predicted deacylase
MSGEHDEGDSMKPTSMVWSTLFFLLGASAAQAQAVAQPQPAVRPTLEQVRSEMGIPSLSLEMRGQLDSVGYATRADQMA